MIPKTADEVKAFCEQMQATILDGLSKGQMVYLLGPSPVYKNLEDDEKEVCSTLFTIHIRHAPRLPQQPNSPPPGSVDSSSPTPRTSENPG